jgi:hypothetical protein
METKAGLPGVTFAKARRARTLYAEGSHAAQAALEVTHVPDDETESLGYF